MRVANKEFRNKIYKYRPTGSSNIYLYVNGEGDVGFFMQSKSNESIPEITDSQWFIGGHHNHWVRGCGNLISCDTLTLHKDLNKDKVNEMLIPAKDKDFLFKVGDVFLVKRGNYKVGTLELSENSYGYSDIKMTWANGRVIVRQVVKTLTQSNIRHVMYGELSGCSLHMIERVHKDLIERDLEINQSTKQEH